MKKNYLSNLENKYYYGISRTFWHFLAAIAVIGFIVGIGIVGWSYFPPSKKEVTKALKPPKEAYPQQANVKLNEILNALPKDKVKIEKIKNISINNTQKTERSISDSKRDTTGLSDFEKQIANLKNTLPFKDFPKLWRGEGYYTYPRGEALYKIKKNESYRKFVMTSPGIISKIENRTDKNGFKSYKNKAELVKRYNQILELIDKKNRNKIIYSLTSFKNRNFEKTIKSLNLLRNLSKIYEKNKIINAFKKNRNFLRNNPNDGIDILIFEINVLQSFAKEERYSASNIIQYEYVNYYNNNLGGIKENTLNFIPFLKKIDIAKQSIALNYYYEIYRSKNVNRRHQIQQIDANYNQLLRKIDSDYNKSQLMAESEFQIKKEKKSRWRFDSFKIIGAALGTILLITLILLLLSMIRNINKLAQAMLDNNKNRP
ncbi:hypothetical protein [Lutibacter sp.]|uniref:hypothetical protein n=1 Tax=Lutibacter sp. TaxID=1925666 RepID=UPI0025BAECE4|nr:hypothetical protein [Lutibacter sp.]MCF6182702.1 hypothetical protein [Lutibacter sp.]